MKRSRQEIISQILEICTKGASKTKIVYQANLNFKTVNPYLELLIRLCAMFSVIFRPHIQTHLLLIHR